MVDETEFDVMEVEDWESLNDSEEVEVYVSHDARVALALSRAKQEIERLNAHNAELESAIDKIIESVGDAALIRVQAIALAAKKKP